VQQHGVRFTRFARSSGLISGFLLPEFRSRGLKKIILKYVKGGIRQRKKSVV
jgi:hypothetical protein